MNFNEIMPKPTDFALPIMNTIDIDKRTKILLKLAQESEPKNPF
jgi:hypothetical protein